MMRPDELVTVCDACFRACCWKGIFMCDESREAGTVERTVQQCIDLDEEHSDYWDGTYERRLEAEDEEGDDGYEPGKSVWSEE